MPSILWLILMAIAGVAVHIARRTSEDIWLVLAGGSAVICMILGLAVAPIPVQVCLLLIVLGFERFTLQRLGIRNLSWRPDNRPIR